MEQDNNITKNIEHDLKLYQISKELEEIKKEREELRESNQSGSYQDLLKYRRGRSKY